MACSLAQRVVALSLPPTWTLIHPPAHTPTPKIHDNRNHSAHCGNLVKFPNEPSMPWRVRPRSVSSLCPSHLNLDSRQCPGQPRQRCHLHLSLEAVISNSFPQTSRGAANGTSKNHVPAMRSGGDDAVIETHNAERLPMRGHQKALME